MNKINYILTLLVSLSLVGCAKGNEAKEELKDYEETSLTKIFSKLKENNFTYSLNVYNGFSGETYNSFYYYTEYSFQTNGDIDDVGVAYKDDVIFKYTYNDEINVTTSALINSSNGIRYSSIYEFITSFNDLDLSTLPTTQDEDGYYVYDFENGNDATSTMMMGVFFRLTKNSLYPQSLKLLVTGNTLEITGVSYSNTDGSNAVVYSGYVNEIGTTENTLIKNYLDAGNGALKSLDKNFYTFFNPYFYTHNYTIDFDATKFKSNGAFSTFKSTEYSTEDAILDVQTSNNDAKSGYFYYLGAVHQYEVENEKLVVTYTPQATTDGDFYDSIYGGSYPCISVSLTDLDMNNLVGYKTDDNTYIITDSQFVTYLGELCLLSKRDECYYTSVEIEILDEENHEFTAHFYPYNYQTKENYGEYTAHFYNINNTKIEYVDNYVSLGDEPTSDTTVLEEALALFKTNNYSLDMLGSGGLNKVYYTSSYFYEETYGNTSSNIGYIAIDDHIYEFSVADDEVSVTTSKDFATSGMTLPGIGTQFQANDDASYFSKFQEEDMYNIDNYQIATFNNITYYKNTASLFSMNLLKYVFGSSATSEILPSGAGFLASKNGDDDYRLTLILTYTAIDGSYSSYYAFTFYDLGKTSYPIIDSYIESLNS